MERYGVEHHAQLAEERNKNKIIGQKNAKYLHKFWKENDRRKIINYKRLKEITSKRSIEMWTMSEYRKNITNKLSIHMKNKWKDDEYRKLHIGANHYIYGKSLSEEHKKILSKANKNNKYSFGKKLSPEHKEKIRQASLNFKHTFESKEKISKKNCKTYNIILISPNNEYYGPVVNLTKFCETHNLNRRHVAAMINNQRKTHKGWRCRTEI